MEEKKCCEGGMCEKFADKKACCGGKCHGCCHMFKILIPIIIIAAAFYLGTVVGHRDGNKERGEGQRYTDTYSPKEVSGGATGDVTVKVLPATTPAPKQ